MKIRDKAVGSRFSPSTLREILFVELDISVHTRLVVAYSGGSDSQALLHCLSRLAHEQEGPGVLAAHYNHGMQRESAEWAENCRQWANEMGVEFVCGHAGDKLFSISNQEARARMLRYEWLNQISQDEDVVLTAHHADDQAETFLLSLFKGKGLQQLSGISPSRPLLWNSKTRLVRPLLAFTRQQLKDYVEHNGLQWIEDPSNSCEDTDRNFLRNSVLPVFYARGNLSRELLNRGATACRLVLEKEQKEVYRLVLENSNPLKKGVFCLVDPIKITIDLLTDEYRFATLLRTWLHTTGLPSPTHRQLQAFYTQISTGSTGYAEIRLGKYYIRYYDRHLFLTARVGRNIQNSGESNWESDLHYLEDQGLILHFYEHGTGLKQEILNDCSSLRLVWNCGRKHLKLPGRNTSLIKKLQQNERVPPWERLMIPNIVYQDKIIWTYGVGIAEGYRVKPPEPGLMPEIILGRLKKVTLPDS